MKLVIDTNIVFSLFKSNSFSNKLLREYNLELFAPDNLIVELEKYADLICSKSGLSKEKFFDNILSLSNIIYLKNPSNYFIEKARSLVKHEGDIPFLALALELNIPIWSNDEHFKEQCLVKVFTTEELKSFLDSG